MRNDCKCGHESWDHYIIQDDPPGYTRDEINEYRIEPMISFGKCEIDDCRCEKYDPK